MQRTKIEWADYSWNPIKGICPVGCWYCYGRRMYKRFGRDPEIRLDLDELMADFPQKPSRIFVCSTFELFHPLADSYRNNVFKHINLLPEHTFIILTKMPERIDRPIPENVWLGTSITGESDVYDRYQGLLDAKARIKFISFEPLFKPVYLPIRINWAIIGRLTGYGHKYDPSRSLLEIMVKTFKVNKIPVFLKNNLREIWGEPLIQESPSLKPSQED